MNATDHGAVAAAAAQRDVAQRLEANDWQRVATDLDADGSAVIEGLLAPAECDSLALLYPIDELFRSRVVMARHGFGRGEYKYFGYPLPDLVAELRTMIYPRLAPIADRWNAQVVSLRQGDAVVFAVQQRPVQGARGVYRVNLRHGVSRVSGGHRHTLGIIFHDAT